MRPLLSLVLLLLASAGRGDDTVAATVGRHTMSRIAELLAGSECRQLQAELNSPEEELEELEELGSLEEPPGALPEGKNPEENNPKGNNPKGNNLEGNNPKGNNPKGNNPKGNNLKGNNPKGNNPKGNNPVLHRRFERSSPVQGVRETTGTGPHNRFGRSPRRCSEALRLWLVTAGEATTWDHLVRALHQIGRSDIARELGKNLNQERSLELRRNVEGYRRSVQHLSSAQLRPPEPRGRRAPLPGEMLFQRQPPPSYSRGLLGWVQPVVLGVFGAFLSSVLLTGTAVYCCHWRRILSA